MNQSLKTKSDESLRRDVVSRACYRARRGAEIAARLERAARRAGNDAALVESELMRRCAEVENLWTATELQSSYGELYDGHGALWNCNGRLCPSCLAARRRRMRKHVREGVSRVRPLSGEHWRLVTLTAPPMVGLPLLQVREVFNRAWSLLRKREWWQSRVRAGVKGEEFTLGDARRLEKEGRAWSLERDGYHFHIHLLVCSRWVEWVALGEEWTYCLTKAAEEKGVSLVFGTSHGRAVVDVRLVVNRKATGRGTVSVEGAVEEVSKYITKSESWLRLPEAQLLEVASVARWFRAVELIGECRQERTEAERTELRARRQERDQEKARRAELARRRGLVTDGERLAALEENAERVTGRRWTVEGGRLVERDLLVEDDFELAAKVREALSWGELPADLKSELRRRTPYLDTKNLSDGTPEAPTAVIGALRARGRPLRALAREVDRQIWLEGLDEHVRQAREWRESELRWRFPLATFRTLAGGVWYGMRAIPPLDESECSKRSVRYQRNVSLLIEKK